MEGDFKNDNNLGNETCDHVPRSVSFTFQPGRLGIKGVWFTGVVEGVAEGTQADIMGILAG